MEDKKIHLTDSEIAYKKGFKWYTLPYEAIRQAYLRIEEVNGRLCCSVASFDMFFLMLKTTGDELIKVEATSKDIVKQMLEEIRKKNEKVEIGYRKNQFGEQSKADDDGTKQGKNKGTRCPVDICSVPTGAERR